MGCCFGSLAKLQAKPERNLKSRPKRKTHLPSIRQRKVQWSSDLGSMENKASISYSVETQISPGPNSVNEDVRLSEQNGNNTDQFVNNAAIAWHERRKEWIGDQSKKTRRVQREPIISWCTTYDDLLSTNQPFVQPIPLTEMVDFLVDIWHEEGLYD